MTVRRCVIALSLILGTVTPAVAQTPSRPAQAPAEAESAPVSRGYLGMISGVQDVARREALLGLEFGVRLRKNLFVAVEAGRLADVVTQSRLDEVAFYAAFVQRTRGVTATGDITGPTLFALANLKYTYEKGWQGLRPYVMAGAGIARVEFKPEFQVDGQTVVGGISTYGITLGKDLLGTTNRVAWGGGAGITSGDKWFLDLGLRVTRIQTTDHPTLVYRAHGGIGVRF